MMDKPTDIERMTDAFMHCGSINPIDCMVLAVKELILILAARDDVNSDAAHSALRTIVADHEAEKRK